MTDLEPKELTGVYDNDDLGNSQRFLDRWGHNLWYLPDGKADARWLSWNGRYWEANYGQAHRWVIETHNYMAVQEVRNATGDDALGKTKWNKKSTNVPRVKRTLEQSRNAPGMRREMDEFDTLADVMTVGNGTVDLRSGRLMEPRREDLISRATDVEYHPDAEAPVWDEFLETVQPDPEVRDFLQRAVGYSLTGTLRDQCLLILYGFGANGKSTFIEAVRNVLGDLAAQTPAATVVGGRDTHPEGLARLRGKRFVTTTETRTGKLREDVVKQISGGDTLTARFMYGESFEFSPQLVLWMAVNELPNITGSDKGIWRRLMPVPFPVTIEAADRDPYLPEKLADEAEGILAWAIEGAVKWHRKSLHDDLPVAITETLMEYREDEDDVSRFLDDVMEADEDAYVTNGDLFKVWTAWAEQQGIERGTAVTLGRKLTKHGIDKGRERFDGKLTRVRLGLRIRQEWLRELEDDLAF